MKKLITLVLILVLAFGLAACTNGDPQSPNADPLPEGQESISCKVMKKSEDSLLIAQTGDYATTGQIYRISISGLNLTTADGAEISTDSIQAGTLLEIRFSGSIQETYPMGLDQIQSVKVTGEEDDMMGFYLSIINDLYQVDQGLNDGISILAFDLSEITNLTEAEKSALLLLAQEEYGHETMLANYEELVSIGLIDDENLNFETGLLIEFSEMSFSKNNFKFTISKWRSSLGAYMFYDCIAQKGYDGNWAYDIGAEMVS